MAFAAHTDLATRLGLTLTSAEQTRATALIVLAQGLIQDETGQAIEEVASDTLTRPGVWSDRLRLPERPVTAVASVTLDGVALVEDDDWYLDGDELVRTSGLNTADTFVTSGGSWGGPEAEVVVVYTHGYSTIPLTVKTVCLEMVVRVWVNPGAVRQEGIGIEQTSYAPENGLLLTDKERDAVKRAVGRTSGTVALR